MVNTAPALLPPAGTACHVCGMQAAPTAQALPQRVGVVVPGGNTTCEAELNRAGLAGLSFHAARMALPKVDAGAGTEARLREAMAPPLRDLASCHVDLVMLGCTSAAMALGARAAGEIMQGVAAGGAIDVGSAILDALRALRLGRIALFTPYLPETNARVIDYLAAAGIETTAALGLGLNASPLLFRAVSRTTPAALAAHLAGLDHSAAEGILICCTDLPTMAALPGLEASTGKPVVSSNQAMVWAIAQHFGAQPAAAGGGLFDA
jgi:maleate isomerase